jgi:ech hydrogenase subunit D
VREEQGLEEIPLGTLLERIQLMKAAGARLAQMACTRLAQDQELGYCFEMPPGSAGPAGPAADGGPRYRTLRVRLPLEGAELPSISSFYWSAFLYENEIHDLFGIAVRGMAVDFHGKFYTLAVPTPYAQKEKTGAE